MGGRLILDLSRGAYTTVSAAVKEYVSNGWDAGARRIEVRVYNPSEYRAITIEVLDNGSGMVRDDLQKKFFRIGRDRRKEEGDFVTLPDGSRRRVHGRKGLGKLAGLRLANVLEVISWRADELVGARVNLREIEASPNEDPKIHWFRPKTKPADFASGTLVRLREYGRRRELNMEGLRYQLCLWFEFGSDAAVKLFQMRGEPNAAAHESEWPISRSELFKELDTHEEQKEIAWEIDGRKETRAVTFRWAWLPKSRTDVRSMLSVVSGTRALSTEEMFDMEVGWTNMFGIYKLLGEVHADWIDEMPEFDPADIRRQGVNWDLHPALEAVRDAGREWVKRVCRERSKAEPEALATRKKVEEIVESRPRLRDLPTRVKKPLVAMVSQYASATGYPENQLEGLVELFDFILEHGALIQFLQELKAGERHTLEEFLEVAENFSAAEMTGLLRVTERKLDLVKELYELVRNRQTTEVPVPGKRDITSFISKAPWVFDPELRIDHKNVGMKRILLERDGASAEVLNRLPIEFWDIRPDIVTYKGPSGEPWCIELKSPSHELTLDEAHKIGDYHTALEAEPEFHDAVMIAVAGTYQAEAKAFIEKTVRGLAFDYTRLLERAINQLQEYIDQLKGGVEALSTRAPPG